MSINNSFRKLTALLDQQKFEILPRYTTVIESIVNKYSPEAEMYFLKEPDIQSYFNELANTGIYDNIKEVNDSSREIFQKAFHIFGNSEDVSVVKNYVLQQDSYFSSADTSRKDTWFLLKIARILRILVDNKITGAKVNVQSLCCKIIYEIFSYTILQPNYVPTKFNKGLLSYKIGNNTIEFDKILQESKDSLESEKLNIVLITCRAFASVFQSDEKTFTEFTTFLSFYVAKLKQLDIRSLKPAYYKIYKPRTYNEMLLKNLKIVKFQRATSYKFENGFEPSDEENDNYYTTLKSMEAAFSIHLRSTCFMNLEDRFNNNKLRHCITQHSVITEEDVSSISSITTNSPFYFLSLGVEGADVQQVHLKDFMSSLEMFRKVLDALLKTSGDDDSGDDVSPIELYRFGGIIINIKELVKTCKRYNRKLVGQNYRPISYTRRGRINERIITDRNNDKNKWACENMAVLLSIDASYNIRNFATQNFERLLHHWTNVIVPHYTSNDNVQTFGTRMNLLNFDDNEDSKLVYLVNDIDKYIEVFFALFNWVYKKTDLKINRGVTKGIENLINNEFVQMKKNGVFPIYDPYQLMAGRKPRSQVDQSDVFRNLVYGYPKDFRSSYKSLCEGLQEFYDDEETTLELALPELTRFMPSLHAKDETLLDMVSGKALPPGISARLGRRNRLRRLEQMSRERASQQSRPSQRTRARENIDTAIQQAEEVRQNLEEARENLSNRENAELRQVTAIQQMLELEERFNRLRRIRNLRRMRNLRRRRNEDRSRRNNGDRSDSRLSRLSRLRRRRRERMGEAQPHESSTTSSQSRNGSILYQWHAPNQSSSSIGRFQRLARKIRIKELLRRRQELLRRRRQELEQITQADSSSDSSSDSDSDSSSDSSSDSDSDSESSESITIQSLDLVANLVSFLDQDLVEDAIEGQEVVEAGGTLSSDQRIIQLLTANKVSKLMTIYFGTGIYPLLLFVFQNLMSSAQNLSVDEMMGFKHAKENRNERDPDAFFTYMNDIAEAESKGLFRNDSATNQTLARLTDKEILEYGKLIQREMNKMLKDAQVEEDVEDGVEIIDADDPANWVENQGIISDEVRNDNPTNTTAVENSATAVENSATAVENSAKAVENSAKAVEAVVTSETVVNAQYNMLMTLAKTINPNSLDPGQFINAKQGRPVTQFVPVWVIRNFMRRSEESPMSKIIQNTFNVNRGNLTDGQSLMPSERNIPVTATQLTNSGGRQLASQAEFMWNGNPTTCFSFNHDIPQNQLGYNDTITSLNSTSTVCLPGYAKDYDTRAMTLAANAINGARINMGQGQGDVELLSVMFSMVYRGTTNVLAFMTLGAGVLFAGMSMLESCPQDGKKIGSTMSHSKENIDDIINNMFAPPQKKGKSISDIRF